MTARASWWTPAHGAALKLAIGRYGSQAKLLENVDLSRSSLIEILAGRSAPKRDTLEAICSEIGADIEELVATPPGGQVESVSSTITVPEIDLAYGMGGTFVDDISVSEVFRQLPADWIRQFTRAPAGQLVLCKGIGDSMMPTLLDSDVLLVDRSQDTLKQSDRIWVLMVGDVGMVKRVRVQPNGNLLILSDNENVPPMEAVDGEAVLVGRVVAIVRKM